MPIYHQCGVSAYQPPPKLGAVDFGARFAPSSPAYAVSIADFRLPVRHFLRPAQLDPGA